MDTRDLPTIIEDGVNFKLKIVGWIIAIVASLVLIVSFFVCSCCKSCRKALMMLLRNVFRCWYFKPCAKLLFTLVKALSFLVLATIALSLFVLFGAIHFAIAISTGCICLTLVLPICIFKWLIDAICRKNNIEDV